MHIVGTQKSINSFLFPSTFSALTPLPSYLYYVICPNQSISLTTLSLLLECLLLLCCHVLKSYLSFKSTFIRYLLHEEISSSFEISQSACLYL